MWRYDRGQELQSDNWAAAPSTTTSTPPDPPTTTSRQQLDGYHYVHSTAQTLAHTDSIVCWSSQFSPYISPRTPYLREAGMVEVGGEASRQQ